VSIGAKQGYRTRNRTRNINKNNKR